MDALLLILGMVALIVFGAPIGLTMIVTPIVYILFTQEVPLSFVPYQMYEALARAPLLAVPLFLLTGELMNTGMITDRLLRLSRELVGRFRGGLAQVNIVASMLFAGMNGSAVADTATVGGILIPAMKKAGYSASFSAAVTAVSSTIGGIVPPSIALVLLASGIGLSVGGLFAAGIIPGLLIGFLLMLMTYGYSVVRNYERNETPFKWSELFSAFIGCWAALLIPAALIGGIVFGIFTATEAGAITAGIALVVGSIIYRSFTFRTLAGSVGRAVTLSAGVFIIIAAAGPFSWLLNRIGALQWLEGWLTSYADQPLLFALAFVGFVFVAGMIMDAVANIIVLGPTLVKIGVIAGYPDFQIATVVSVGFLLGTVTPPIGICYFTAGYIADEKLEKVALALLPFILIEVFALFLLLWFPPLTMWLPGVMGL